MSGGGGQCAIHTGRKEIAPETKRRGRWQARAKRARARQTTRGKSQCAASRHAPRRYRSAKGREEESQERDRLNARPHPREPGSKKNIPTATHQARRFGFVRLLPTIEPGAGSENEENLDQIHSRRMVECLSKGKTRLETGS